MITKRKELLEEKDYNSIESAIKCLTQELESVKMSCNAVCEYARFDSEKVTAKDEVESIFQLGNCGNFALCLYKILKPLYDDVILWKDTDNVHVFISIGTHAYDITGDITEDWKRKLALNDIIVKEYGEEEVTLVHVVEESEIEDYIDNYSLKKGGPII